MKKIILGVLTLIGSLVLAFVIFSGGGNPDSQAEAYGPQATEQSEVADTMADMPGMAPASEDHADDAHDEADTDHVEDEHAQDEADTMADMPGMAPASEDHAEDAHDEADADHVEDEHAHDEVNADHTEEESGGHGHGAPRVGYIGMEAENETTLDDAELDAFVDRVQEEAYQKGEVDQIRFVIFGGFFVLAYLSFAKIKVWDLSNRLRNAIDWHTVGTVSGMILIFLVIPSGIIITFVYMPTSTGVYASVEKMVDQPVLAFFRNLHNWSSEIFVFLSLLHAARTVSTKTFLGKRKLIWLLGALAFVAGWVAFLSGTFMRGDQEALEGFEHMMYSFRLVPLGNYISDFFSGEFTIMKLTALHIGVTMFIIALTLTLHVLMRKVHVLVTRRWKKALIYTLALTAFLVVQSIWMEAPFVRGTAAGPTISGIEATKPPWPIYFLIQGENWFGANAMVAIMLVAFVPLIIFPYAVEFLPLSPAKKARVGEALFYAGVFAMIVVSYIAAAGQIKAHIFM